jgi:hypothetical protein
MSRRRNAKKEKAERNKVNARKFRKTFSRYSRRNNKYSSGGQKSSETEENKSSSSEPNSGT